MCFLTESIIAVFIYQVEFSTNNPGVNAYFCGISVLATLATVHTVIAKLRSLRNSYDYNACQHLMFGDGIFPVAICCKCQASFIKAKGIVSVIR